MPTVNIFNFKVNLCIGCHQLGYNCPLCILNNVAKLLTIAEIFNPCFNLDLCIRALNYRCDFKTGTAVVHKLKMRIINTDNVYITIKTAIECKVSHLRINSIISRVINSDYDKVINVKSIGNINAPG